MVAPHQRAHFFNILKKFKIYYESFISNVQEKLEAENFNNMAQSRESGFSFTQYHRLDVVCGCYTVCPSWPLEVSEEPVIKEI